MFYSNGCFDVNDNTVTNNSHIFLFELCYTTHRRNVHRDELFISWYFWGKIKNYQALDS